ncbi:response regulator [Xylophilus rhododendri]|uniref:Response regulator n=1 Tax=Xylophilus rhododendri TaxID=2697032 RepID=A0A857IZ25_9BURK|nr:response regulator [Xylophilus rhododendri]QHI96706.1 response regulator [Xylophilus rhododendri]
MTKKTVGAGTGAAAAPVISIVDDDRSVRLALCTLLRSVGLQARAWASGEEFLQSGLDEDVACLIVDLRMRGMSGLELQRRLAQAGRTIPVIFISAHGDEDARQRAQAAGAIGFLGKPFDEQALLACVARALERAA